MIAHLGAKPVFVDVKEDQNIDENKIENKITKNKSYNAVHLTGRMCSMDKILKISKRYNIPVIEDCAQSIMSKYKNICWSMGNYWLFFGSPFKKFKRSWRLRILDHKQSIYLQKNQKFEITLYGA